MPHPRPQLRSPADPMTRSRLTADWGPDTWQPSRTGVGGLSPLARRAITRSQKSSSRDPSIPQTCPSASALPARLRSSAQIPISISFGFPNPPTQLRPVDPSYGNPQFFGGQYDVTVSDRLSTPILFIAKTHDGTLIQGQTGATYSVIVTNTVGAVATSGAVTVTEFLPAGISMVSMAGDGWACGATNCTRSDSLAGGASYPPITVTVNVAANAASPQVNAVSVSGGGSASADASDPAIVHAAPARASRRPIPTPSSRETLRRPTRSGFRTPLPPAQPRVW